MYQIKEITIIGGTGKLGIPVSLHLAQAGFQVTVVARNPDKAERFFGPANNIRIVEGDLEDPASLKKALKDTRFLYLNLSTNTTDQNIPFAEEREGIANVLSAVDRNKIEQILCISGLGAFQTDIVPEKYAFVPNLIRSQGHQLIKESGIPYTILHCSWFIDSFIIYQRKGTYSVVGENEHPIYFINAYDYSLQLAQAVGNPNAFNKEYPIQGKEGLVHADAARKFLHIYDPEVKVSKLPGGMISVMALFIGPMKLVKAMDRYFKHSREAFLAEKHGTYADLGEPQLSLEQYAQKLKTEKSAVL